MRRITCWLGTCMCKVLKGVWYNTIRHSLRSGNWHIVSAYRMSKKV